MPNDYAELVRLARDPLGFNDPPNRMMLAMADAIEALSAECARLRAGEGEAVRDVAAAMNRIEALKTAMREACDFLAERAHGSPARSPGHNARVRLESTLAADQPAAGATEGKP